MQDKTLSLGARYTTRALSRTDFDAVLAVMNAHERTIENHPLTTAEQLEKEWNDPEYDFNTTQAVFTPDDELIAFVSLGIPKQTPVRPFVEVFFRLEEVDDSVVAALLAWAEQTSNRVFDEVPEDARVTLVAGAESSEARYKACLEAAGYRPTGQAWHKMLIEMESKPEALTWPPDVQVITAAGYDDLRAIFEAQVDSFQDHRGYIETDRDTDFKRWLYYNVEDEKIYDPSLWFLALVDGQIAAVNLARPYNISEPDEGYVHILGTRREYRGRGIAKALLVHSFREFWERGKRKVSLYVDGSSKTGADKLYVRAGMHVARIYETYEKMLRDGVELSVQ